MACSSSFIGVYSIYQAPSLELSRRTTATPSLFLPFSSDKSHFNGVKAFTPHLNLKQISGGGGVDVVGSFVASAIATNNSSMLSEEAFSGFGGFDNDSLNVSESDYESEADAVSMEGGSEDELALTKLGLPQRPVESHESRGITHLFPIQRAMLVPALEGRDIIARAKTGTGKTLALGIPIIKRLSEDEQKRSSQRCSG